MLKEARESLGLKKLRAIISGWKNYAFENEAVESVAKLRAIECAKCPFAVKGIHDQVIDDRIEEIEGYMCDLCKCPLSGLLRSMESACKDNRWHAVS